MQKKRWQRPKLVVLIRGKSEETVLQGCKTQNWDIGVPEMIFGGCDWGLYCTKCSSLESS